MKAGFYNSGMNGQVQGFYVYPVAQADLFWLWHKTIYQYDENSLSPMTFVHPDGRWIRPNKSFQTDQGSIPRVYRVIIDKDRFLIFYLHDSGYMEKGLWVSLDQGKTWTFQEMTRAEVDDLLLPGISFDPCPGNAATAYAVWSAVRIFGGMAGWGKGDRKKRKQ
jgi:hypothetical protein